jgi:hypothetical protein
MKNGMRLGAMIILLWIVGFTSLRATTYYWNGSANDGSYINLANWDSVLGVPDLLINPITISDDVFFTGSGTTISLGGGNCRNFNVPSATGTFTFNGFLTAINGNINCPNGNVFFSFATNQNITGSGNHFINLGTNAQRIANGKLVFANSTNTGTYTLMSGLNAASSLEFVSQNILSNGFPITAIGCLFTGTAPKTIDLSNSLLRVRTNTNGGGITFNAPSSTTNYVMGSTDLVLEHPFTAHNSGISLASGVQVTIDELTLFAEPASNQAMFIDAGGSTVALTALTMNILHLNTPSLDLGRLSFLSTNTSGVGTIVLNIGTLEFQQPSTITSDKGATLNLGAVVESPLCRGQSAIMSIGASPVIVNTTTPITTTSIAYFGATMGGSGITASSSHDLGNNTGAITWGAVLPPSTFRWVGGTGNWGDPTKWTMNGAPQSAAGCLPTLQDDVVFDAGSFTGNQTVSLGASNGFCKNISWTGINQGALTGGRLVVSIQYTGNLYVNGSADFSGSRGIGANLFFVGNALHTIRSGAFAPYTSPVIRIMGRGSYTLMDAMIGTATSAVATFFQHTGGTFNANGQTLDVAHFTSRSLPEMATNPRTLSITNAEINTRMAINANFTLRRTIDVSFLTALNAVGSHFRIHGTDPSTVLRIYRGNASPAYLSPCNLYDVSFTATSGTPSLSYLGLSGISDYHIRCHDVSFASNGIMEGWGGNASITVDNYNFSSGYTYFFTALTNQAWNVNVGINTIVSGCQNLVRIQSLTPGLRAYINKPTGLFPVNGAIVTDIHATGQTMQVANGLSQGNNINVTVGTASGRTMYWVNDAGNWSDGIGHWSIGVSGGNPTVTNPLGCIPRAIDDVVFDGLSFTGSNQVVQLDIDGNCRNMLWTATAGVRMPRFDGIITQNLYVYGSLELGSGMLSPYLGRIYMQGTSLVANSQSIDVNGVIGNGSLWLNGGGRYDLLEGLSIASLTDGLILTRGDFRSNAFPIDAGAVSLDARGTNRADISNSTITVKGSATGIGAGTVNSYRAYHDATGGWNATGSTLQSDALLVNILNTAPVNYGNVIMNSLNPFADIVGSASQRVTFRNVTWRQTPLFASGGSMMDGVFTIDTLRYGLTTYNYLQPGGARSYTIADTLIVLGTPCIPSYIRSAVPTNIAVLNSTRCNFDLRFTNLMEINAGTCTAAQNRVVGVNEGGNSNWTFSSIAGLTSLGADTAIVCNGAPLNISASGFGSISGMTYTWSTGATTSNINTTAAGNYAVTVSYGTNCTATDNIVVTCSAILPLAPITLRGAALAAVNQLDWEVNGSDALSHFVVERSVDGDAFVAIGSVSLPTHAQPGATYDFTDRQPSIGTQYYRLQQHGRDGDDAYSNTVAITRLQGASGIACYPNPTQGRLTLDVQGFGEGITGQLINAAGQPVATLALVNGQHNIDLGDLPSALYTLVVRDVRGATSTLRVQVQR